MRNLAAIFFLAGCSASVHPNPTPPPGDSDPLEATISDLVHQLESDLMDERQAAATKLVRLGHAVIPSLRRKSQEAPPALQNELSVVIKSIRYTDFLFMVRPEPWSITASLENTGIVEAHRELFGRKPLHPPLDIGLKRPFGDRALVLPSFTLKSASYWKA